MKRYILIILLGFTFQMAHSVELTVRVLEKGTGEPVVGATVVLTQSSEYDETDELGKVVFDDLSSEQQLKVLSAGYETLFANISKNQSELSVYLLPLSVEGSELVVTAERIEEQASKISLSVQELMLVPGSGGDPLKVIDSLPGVVSSSNAGGGPPGGFYVRGSDQNENTAWVNRTPIGYLYHFGGLYSTINPAMLSDFNVFLGGYQAEYEDVLGGVLDVKLRSPKKDRLRQEYSIGTYQSSIFLEGPVGEADGKHGFFFAARRSYIDLLLSPETLTSFIQDDDDDLKPENQKNKIVQVPVFHDIQAIWEYESSKGTVRTSYFEASDKFKAVFNENRILDPQSAGELGLAAGYKSLSVNWENSWNANVYHTLPIVLAENKTRFQFGTDTDGTPFYFDIENRDLFIQPEIQIQRGGGNRWAIGNQFVYARTPIDAKITRQPSEGDIGESDFTTEKKITVDRVFKSGAIAPYAKYTHLWDEKIKTIFGLRYSYVRISGGAEFKALLPRFNFEYEFIKDTWFNGTWGDYVQLPRGSELADGSGNPNLSYTKAEHRIIGIKHKREKVWTYQLELFQKPMTSLVLPIDENEPPDNYSNEGKGEAYGLDLLIKRDLSGGRTGWLSYSYIKTTRTGRDNITRPFSGDQPHTLTLLWSQKLSGSWKKWTMGVRYQWHSGLPYDPVIGVNNVPIEGSTDTRPVPVYPETKNSKRLPSFQQLDFRVERKFLFNTWKMNFYIDIQNILNTKNTTEFDYGDNYENIDDPEPISSGVLFPAFGIEAKF